MLRQPLRRGAVVLVGDVAVVAVLEAGGHGEEFATGGVGCGGALVATVMAPWFSMS